MHYTTLEQFFYLEFFVNVPFQLKFPISSFFHLQDNSISYTKNIWNSLLYLRSLKQLVVTVDKAVSAKVKYSFLHVILSKG